MSLIDMFAAALGAMRPDVVAVHDERCISVRNRNAHCARCAEACTSGCITLEGNAISVDPERCIGCGTCATACPTSAIEVVDPDDAQLTKLVKASIVATQGHPVIMCGRALEGTGVSEAAVVPQAVVLPCLGRIDESLLAGIAAYKAFDATLVCGGCEGCEHAPGGALVRRVVAGAQNMVSAYGGATMFSVTEELPEGIARAAGGHFGCSDAGSAVSAAVAGGSSRRDFFRQVKSQATQAASAAVSEELDAHLGPLPAEPSVPAAYRKVNAAGTLSHHVPTRRTRLYNYLNHIGAGSPVDEGMRIRSRVIGAVEIDSARCTSCRMCAVFCPTGALEKVDDASKGLFGVVHRPAACMQCRLCERICAAGAIQVRDEVPVRQFVGKQAVVFPLARPEWTPNTPTSMYDKFRQVYGKNVNMSAF